MVPKRVGLDYVEDFIKIYEAAFSSVNLPYTILLIVILVYWCVVIIGLVDIDAFDIDLETDLDVEGDVDFNGRYSRI